MAEFIAQECANQLNILCPNPGHSLSVCEISSKSSFCVLSHYFCFNISLSMLTHSWTTSNAEQIMGVKKIGKNAPLMISNLKFVWTLHENRLIFSTIGTVG